MTEQWRWIVSGVLALGALAVGVPMMLLGESNVNPAAMKNISQIYDQTASSSEIRNLPEVAAMVDDGLKPYFWGMGAIFILVALAYILADGRNKITTLTGRASDEN